MNNTSIPSRFDTLQVIDDLYVPKSLGGEGKVLEPITNSYPQYGAGGYSQLKVDDKIINFDKVTLIPKGVKK